MAHHPGRWFLYTIAAVVGLLVLATGPIGLAIAIMIGVPILVFAGFEAAAHGPDKPPVPRR